jgi:phosphoserine phosphatase
MVALFDWDGTLHPGFTVFPWSRFLSDRGLFTPRLADHLGQLLASYQASQLTHDELAIECANVYAEGALKVATGSLRKAAQEFVLSPAGQLYSFARPVLALLQSAGIRNVVISGAPSEVLKAYLPHFPLQDVWGLDVQRDEDIRLIVNRGLSYEKEQVVESYRHKFFIAFGFGNSAADLPLLEAASVAVLINGSASWFPPSVRHRLMQCTEQNVETLVREQTLRLQLRS